MCKRCKSDTLVSDVCLNGIMSIDGLCRTRNVREPHIPANHVLNTSTAATLQGVVMTARHGQASATASVQSKVAEQVNLMQDQQALEDKWREAGGYEIAALNYMRHAMVGRVADRSDEGRKGERWIDTNADDLKLSAQELREWFGITEHGPRRLVKSKRFSRSASIVDCR
jgi:hypothetical protein